MAKDRIHYIVVAALIKDGWDITHDPLYVSFDANERDFEVDLGAEKLIGAEKENMKIAIEVKSFTKSISNEFHGLLGQYLDYKAALAESTDQNDRTLFIALPEEIYAKIDSIAFFKRRIKEYEIKFITVDLIAQTISEWIP